MGKEYYGQGTMNQLLFLNLNPNSRFLIIQLMFVIDFIERRINSDLYLRWLIDTAVDYNLTSISISSFFRWAGASTAKVFIASRIDRYPVSEVMTLHMKAIPENRR